MNSTPLYKEAMVLESIITGNTKMDIVFHQIHYQARRSDNNGQQCIQR
jgi:hypothetical protein